MEYLIDPVERGIAVPQVFYFPGQSVKSGWGGRLLKIAAGFSVVGGLLAEWNRKNNSDSGRTSHNRFHAAFTTVLSSLLGTTGLYFLSRKEGDEKLNLAIGTLLPAFFFTSMLTAFAFPEAKGQEPESVEVVPGRNGIRLNKGSVALFMLTLSGIGFYKEYSKLS
jgi:hypothetical protein